MEILTGSSPARGTAAVRPFIQLNRWERSHMRMSKAKFYSILALLAAVSVVAIAAGRHQAAKPPRPPHVIPSATHIKPHQPVRSATVRHG